MDFSTEFVALRDRLLETQDKAFRTQTNVEVAGRMAALCSSFTIKSERKILGLMPTGGVGHAHEYRLLFAVPKLGADELADWWAYAERVFETLVEPDENHDFSTASVSSADGAPEMDAPSGRKLDAHEQQFEGGKHGWGSVRMACVDLEAHKLCVSRMGDSLKNIMKAVL